MQHPNARKKGRDVKKNWQPDIFDKFIWTSENMFLQEGLAPEGNSIMPNVQYMQMLLVQGVTNLRNQELPPKSFSYIMNSEPFSALPPLRGHHSLSLKNAAMRAIAAFASGIPRVHRYQTCHMPGHTSIST